MSPVATLKSVAWSPDVLLAVAVVAIVGALVAPLPGWVLDTLIAANLAAGCALLVAALFAKDALKVAAFPTLLLITTLFRLMLNVSATKLALAEAHAGRVIQAIGEFVVGGNYVVGGVVFAILTLVQFVVVAKGAERVAEVAARFTLDAMPGKQMSIDSDLRSGAIDQAEARHRRRALERESQLYGAMDGAMKFVKGDAIAGIVVVVVNVLGGLCVGVLMKGMDAGTAARTYTLLAIGDGLVSEIPSLCVALSAGFVVTRVASEDASSSLGSEIGAQFLGQPRALAFVSGMLALLGVVPGMPVAPFFVLAALSGAGAWGLHRRRAKQEGNRELKTADRRHEPPQKESQLLASGGTPQPVPASVSPLCLDLGEGMDALAQEEGGRLVGRDLAQVREAIFGALGVRVPGIRVRTGAAYLGKAYAILVDEVPCSVGEVVPGAFYALQAPDELAFLHVDTEEATNPLANGPIARIDAADVDKVRAAGVEVKGARDLLVAHVRFAVERQAKAFLGVQETQALIDGLDGTYPALVREATQRVPVPLIAEVLRRLVEEGVSIKNLRVILESFAAPGAVEDGLALAERARRALRRQISYRLAGKGPLYAYLCDPEVEEAMRKGIAGAQGGVPAIDPDDAAAILRGMKLALEGATTAVVLTSADIRRYLRKLCEGAFPEVAVVTYTELAEDCAVRPLGKIALARAEMN